MIVWEEPIADLEAAWDHARGFLELVKVNDSGEVSGMEEALDKLVGRYPYLLDDEEEDGSPPPRSSGPRNSGRTPRPKPPGDPGKSALQKRFPALKGETARTTLSPLVAHR